MARVKRALDGRDAHIWTLRFIILMLCGVIAFAMHGWSKAPERIMVDIPPDLRSGSTRRVGEREPYSVYAFALYIHQALNHWPVSGTDDYRRNIEQLSCYLTPEFKASLLRDVQQRANRSELKRARYMAEMPGRPYEAKRVWIESKESWIAFMDASIKETYEGTVIKDSFIRYPIRVVNWDVAPECNPFGLALDGYHEDPKRLEGSNLANDGLAAN